jgi:hypothetical protein
MSEFGTVTFHTTERVITGAAWDGPPVTVISLPLVYEILGRGPHVGDVFWVGPYQVRVTQRYSWVGDGAVVERINGPISVRLRLQWFKAKRPLILINGRVLRTLWIWNLLDVIPGSMLTWADVRPIKWLRNILSRLA